jgi:hypothetical protein
MEANASRGWRSAARSKTIELVDRGKNLLQGHTDYFSSQDGSEIMLK